jgi:hypothetical protein
MRVLQASLSRVVASQDGEWNLDASSRRCTPERAQARTMKWMLVILVGGVTPVNTNLVFEKFADRLAAEEQMRRHYADAVEAWRGRRKV